MDSILDKDEDDSSDDETEELAGSVPVIGLNETMIKDVEKLLSKLCKDISSKLHDMIQQSPYQEQVTNAFGAIHDFQVSAADFQKALEMLESLVNTFPDKDKNSFNLNLALSGFVDWDLFQSEQKRKMGNISIEDNWIAFSKKCDSEDKKEFKRLFEYCMIDVMSEALAETVGSIMNHHLGSGSRASILPKNLNSEIFTRYNLGPLHCVDDVVQSVVMRRLVEDRISYKRVLDDKRPEMLKAFGRTSSSVYTFRRKEELKCHLPLSIWKD